MYVAKTCATLLVRDRSLLQRGFRVSAPYMGEDPELVNPGEINIQGTRHADVIKLWLTMQLLGRNGTAYLIDQSMLLVQQFATMLRDAGMELAAHPTTNLICFRPPAASDATVTAVQQRLHHAGSAFFSVPTWHGQRWLRSVVLNPFVDVARLQTIVSQLQAVVADAL
ncbi:MAG: hypothetical protein EBS29_13710 [Chloroflexia bacterium]|nr:hypothetical protein [Chloroflexia bacterium]